MADDEIDPFEGLVLDEDFVRGAKAYEPPARTREALSRHQPGPARAWSPEPARRRSRRRTWLVVVVVLALVGGVSYLQQGFGGDAPATAGPAPGGSATPSPGAELQLVDSTFDRGHCYTWDQKAQYTRAEDVPCASAHLFLAVTRMTLTGFPRGAPFPTDAQRGAIDERVCSAAVTGFLHHALDPHGRYDIGDIGPVRRGWEEGDRNIVCGVQSAVQQPFDTAPVTDLVPFSGAVDVQHQARLAAPGTCLQRVAGEERQVACTALHTEEISGAATVTGGSVEPTGAAYERIAFPACERVTTAYTGRRPTGRATASLYDVLRAESWSAGTRQINCYLQLNDAQGRATAVRGSHRGVGRSA